jgi:hypothetical protein
MSWRGFCDGEGWPDNISWVLLRYRNTAILLPAKVLYIDPQSPPPSITGYQPPKGGAKKVKNNNGRGGSGWKDTNGNVWVPDNTMHGSPGWVVQYPRGGHHHAYPDGHIRYATKQPFLTPRRIASFGLLAVLILDDFIGVGVADDVLIPAAAGFALMPEATYYCDVCRESW